MKHPKHLKYRLATCTFSVASTYCLNEHRLVNTELDAGAELDAVECRGGRGNANAHTRLSHIYFKIAVL
jgi:hypothetical protein